MWHHCCHVGGQKQYIFSPLGNKILIRSISFFLFFIYFHAKLFHCFSPPTCLPWKPSILIILQAEHSEGQARIEWYSLLPCSVFIPQCSFMEFKDYKVVYKRYASLYIIVGVDSDEVKLYYSPWTFVVAGLCCWPHQIQDVWYSVAFSSCALFSHIN